jgi:hypothetical protein
MMNTVSLKTMEEGISMKKWYVRSIFLLLILAVVCVATISQTAHAASKPIGTVALKDNSGTWTLSFKATDSRFSSSSWYVGILYYSNVGSAGSTQVNDGCRYPSNLKRIATPLVYPFNHTVQSHSSKGGLASKLPSTLIFCVYKVDGVVGVSEISLIPVSLPVVADGSLERSSGDINANGSIYPV